MKKETILKAMTDINDDFIAEAAPKGYLPKEKTAFSWFNMKMLAGAFAVLMMAIILPRVLQPSQSVPGGNDNIQLVRPYESVETMAQAEKLTGFALECPETHNEWTLSGISVYNNNMIDAAYTDAEDEIVMHIRKAPGEDDISGDFNTYESSMEIGAGNYTVTAKGENGRFYLLTWTKDGYSYAVSFTNGVNIDTAAQIISSVH